MSKHVKGVIVCLVIVAALSGLVYWNNMRLSRFYDFNPRADENSEGQCP